MLAFPCAKMWLYGIYVPAKTTLENTGTDSCVREDFSDFLKYYLCLTPHTHRLLMSCIILPGLLVFDDL